MKFLTMCVMMSATMYHEPQHLACGGEFIPEGYSVAHKNKNKYPCGTMAFLSYGKKTVPVIVNDRGPWNSNELDISQGAAKAIGFPGKGKVCLQVIEDQ